MNYKHILTSCIVALALVFSAQAQQTPAPKQTEAISIVGATAHIGNTEVIENSVVVFEDGKITYVGTDVSKAKGNQIKAEGKHVYPGFIAPNATLGLVEIDAVAATDDEDELGKMLPHVRSLIAYNAESQVVESMRPNGVLMGQITPQGGRISGTSSVVQFDAWNWEDAVIKKDDAIHLNWPSGFSLSGSWSDSNRVWEKNKEYTKEIDEVVAYFQNAKTYVPGSKERDLEFEAMAGLFDGSKALFVHADGEKEIKDAISFKRKMNLERVTIVGGYHAYKVAEDLAANDVSVLVQRTHLNPSFEDDDYDLPYKLPKLLSDAGVLVALEGSGRMERMNSRNLPFYAGTAAAFGVEKELAVQMITLNTAKILGMEDQIGSLEAGKDATLFISEGDALDMQGNIMDKVYIQGRDVSLETHQTELSDRYSKKYQE
ncbi:amidohydrolase family protein [Psychroflexus montanilacus]|uniref:amidohydrolase family protein n=1 Tax=Psychroflexus montanilacus TaxID=2873598 RepID=UPI001CCBE727|nr:amidohydrolase family protein [Psychroflexus montanilacus]MBZ9653047.1 amidohydrolase family protein [Psychroflexus montanilacus]